MKFKFITKSALLALPALALAAQAYAALPAGLADTTQPGSVIVFPKFINAARVTVDGISAARTEIELGAVCPPLAAFARNQAGCVAHSTVFVRLHWVCPGAEGFDSNICRETDFDVVLSTNGKLVFSADGNTINGNSPIVPAPKCQNGYLIGWVTDNLGRPIKFDGLIGNAVIRGPNVTGGASTAISAYNALAIQANDADPQGAFLGAVNSSSPIVFSATNAPGTYKTVTGVQVGDVRFDNTAGTGQAPNILSKTFLTLLTLDVRSNQSNNPVMVDIDFWNESLAGVSGTNPNFERLLSTFTTFVCWEQVSLTTAINLGLGNGQTVVVPPIDPNLNQGFMGTRKGVVLAGPAVKQQDGNAPADGDGPVTLIGLVETCEGTVADGFQNRKYNFNMSNDGVPVTTAFIPRSTP